MFFFFRIILFFNTFVAVKITGKETIYEGDTAHFSGMVQFHPKIKHIKWQKYQNDTYIDIDIRTRKYEGSTNDLRNPKLHIHNVNQHDEVKYTLEVKRDCFTVHSNLISLRVVSHFSGKIYLDIYICG